MNCAEWLGLKRNHNLVGYGNYITQQRQRHRFACKKKHFHRIKDLVSSKRIELLNH